MAAARQQSPRNQGPSFLFRLHRFCVCDLGGRSHLTVKSPTPSPFIQTAGPDTQGRRMRPSPTLGGGQGGGPDCPSLSISGALPGTVPPPKDHALRNPCQALAAGNSNQRVSSQSQITREKHTHGIFQNTVSQLWYQQSPALLACSFPVSVRRDRDVHQAEE